MVVYQFLGMLGRPVKQRASRKKSQKPVLLHVKCSVNLEP